MDKERAALLGKRLRDRRLALGLTQPNLAQAAKVSKAYVSKLEKGHGTRPAETELTRVLKELRFTSVDDAIASGQINERGPREIRSEVRAPYLTAAAPSERPERLLYSHAGAAARLSDHTANPESVGEEVPPFLPQLGPDPIGVLIEGDSMLGAGVRPGMVAWINTTDRPYYKDGDLVLVNVREKPVDELVTVIKRLRRENGEYVLYSEPERGKVVPFTAEYLCLLAPVECVRDRQPPPRKPVFVR